MHQSGCDYVTMVPVSSILLGLPCILSYDAYLYVGDAAQPCSTYCSQSAFHEKTF